MNQRIEQQSHPLAYYSHLVRALRCPSCAAELEEIQMYAHDGGWRVDGFEKKQWLSAKCPDCRYEWSLWKLGIFGDVMHPEPEIGVFDNP